MPCAQTTRNPFLFIGIVFLALSSCKKDDAVSGDDQPDPQDFEIAWSKTFGGSGEEDAAAIVETNDGGYAVLGYTQSTDGHITDKTTPDNDFWLFKISEDGTLQWSKTYGGSEDDKGTDITTTTDGGFLVSGYTRSNDGDVSENAGFYDYWIMKLDASGNKQWEKSYGFSGNDQAHAVVQTADGGYMITGFLDVTASGGAGNDSTNAKSSAETQHGVGEYWAIKTNANGEKEWRRYFGGTNNDRSYDLVETDNGDFILVGNSESDDFDITDPKGSYDFWAVRISGSGDLVWAKNYGGSNIEIAYAITKTSDGNYLLVGDSRSTDKDVSGNYGNADAWLVKIDGNGAILWEKNYGGTAFDTGRAVVELQNDNLFLAGSTRSADQDIANNYGGSDFWLLETSPEGDLIWELNSGGSQLEFANAATKDQNNAVIVVGSSESADFDVPENRGAKDVLIVKLTK